MDKVSEAIRATYLDRFVNCQMKRRVVKMSDEKGKEKTVIKALGLGGT